MWNPITITKSLNDIVNFYTVNYEHQSEEEKLGIPVTKLYREMQFPFGLMMMNKATQTTLGQDVVWGRKHNDIDYVEKKVLPILIDKKYLTSLPDGTVGKEYYKIAANLGIETLYNQRFKVEEVKTRLDIIRTNLSRHTVVSHDILHTLFKYNTHALGEALIQEVTGELLNYKPSKIIGFFILLAVLRKTKDKNVWKVYKECKQVLKNCKKEIGYRSPIEFLESDLEEVRQKFNIGEVPLYEAFEKKYHNYFSPDSCRHIEKFKDNSVWDQKQIYLNNKQERKIEEI